jgi:hypothetical protein
MARIAGPRRKAVTSGNEGKHAVASHGPHHHPRPLCALGLLWLVISGCVSVSATVRRPLPQLSTEQVAALVPASTPEREGWAQDVHDALSAQSLGMDVRSVCSVLAVIEQESGYRADPPVPGLSRIVRERLKKETERFGPLGEGALHEVLQQKAIGHDDTFDARIDHAKTERDVDRIFRDLLATYQARHPTTYAAANLLGELFTSRSLEDMDPITTAGSMQVSVRFAQQLASKKLELSAAQLREELYTRRGGVFYGAARLLGYEASYDDPVYRFADYNAGLYASRNASVQSALTRLTGLPLAMDGDLLSYDAQARPKDEDSQSLRALLAFRSTFAPDLSERQLRRDVLHEKERAFEQTDTWAALTKAFLRVTGRPMAPAVIPTVIIRSPKMKSERSTAWYAASVDRRFKACLGRAQGPTQGN